MINTEHFVTIFSLNAFAVWNFCHVEKLSGCMAENMMVFNLRKWNIHKYFLRSRKIL